MWFTRRRRADREVARRHAIELSAITLRRLVAEAVSGILQRPGRSVLTATGTVLGVGAFISVLGITASANGQISDRFNRFSASEVTVAQPVNPTGVTVNEFPSDAERRVAQIRGVRHSGTYFRLNGSRVSSAPRSADAPVLDEGIQDQSVAVVGKGLAASVGLRSVEGQPAIFIDGVRFTVIGIETATRRMPGTLLAVVIPQRRALRVWQGAPDKFSDFTMLIETQLGAAKVVAEQAPLVLRPDDPQVLTSAPPVEPTLLKDTISSDLSSLFLALAAILLFVGAVGIANTTLVAVLERVPEIGLRRAVGACRRHIGIQFLAESTLLGFLGGLIGSSIGSLATIGVAVSQDWSALMSPGVVVLGPLAGAATGLLAGLYPALRAARIEPVEAFRR